ncbi:MAG: DUF6273 domain-containing protein [Bacilli bacterium]|nr:DUF6273 domain-containing protein [Bacilli bacterium]MDD4608098.1 DUF6273 domain-containing protein [Bacilli bacterium]
MKKYRLSKRKISLLFVIVNITVLLLITSYYGYRLIHYYRLENPKVVVETLSNVVTLEKNLALIGDGLYKQDDLYYFKGTKVNNYVLYSGRLWQIVSVNEKGNVKLITTDNQTSLVWGKDNNYQNSYIREWLNSTSNQHSGIFYKTLSNPELYLEKSSWCIDIVLENPDICNSKIEDKIGLLSINEYNRALGSNSYLNIDSYWWTINGASDNKVWYVYPEGKLNNESYHNDSYFSYGIRPVINLKKDITLYGGNGTKETPYIIERGTSNILKTKRVGEYLKYANYNWRIASVTEDYVEVYMDGNVLQDNENMNSRFSTSSNLYSIDKGIGKYLNTTFYENLTNKEYIVSGKWYVGNYDDSIKYNYKNIYNKSIEAKVGMLSVGNLFVEDYEDYFLMTRPNNIENTIYKVVENGQVYADLMDSYAYIRPAIKLKTDIVILSGTGKKDKPYIIE